MPIVLIEMTRPQAEAVLTALTLAIEGLDPDDPGYDLLTEALVAIYNVAGEGAP